MDTKLPRFEGRDVEGATLKLSGKAESRVGALGDQEAVFLIVKGHVSKISHGDATVNGATVFVREHTVKASELVILDPDDGERMLSEGAMLADEKFGLMGLFQPESGPDSETGEVGGE